MWLIFRRKLRTQDLIPSWDVSTSLGNVCSLCETVMDSHEHIFFECSFSQGIWDRIKRLAGLERYPPNIYDIFHTMLPFINRRTTCSVVAKLLIAAAAYYVWQERNWRLFKKGKRSPDQLVECIRSSVRLRLFSCTFKKSKDGERMAKLWDLPEAIFR
ncbi:reverse transcriptase domain, reverse transcriptase zinc-binding domain protein [Tanacetum coccineum]